MPAAPIISIIKTHGVVITHYPAAEAEADQPWQLRGDKPQPIEMRGIIQKIKPEDHPDLPEGSLNAVMVLVLSKTKTKPRPGDSLEAEGRSWRIKTILPLLSTRQKSVVEVLVTSSGNIDHG